MTRYSADSSSIIHAWAEYPITHFPSLWTWLGGQLENEIIVLSKVAYDEIKRKTIIAGEDANEGEEQCADWLKKLNIKAAPIGQEIVDAASQISENLGIKNAQYHPKGVGENDLFIIAHAKVFNCTLITEESEQLQLPDLKEKYRIPAVCRLQRVKHCRLVDVIKESELKI